MFIFFLSFYLSYFPFTPIIAFTEVNFSPWDLTIGTWEINLPFIITFSFQKYFIAHTHQTLLQTLAVVMSSSCNKFIFEYLKNCLSLFWEFSFDHTKFCRIFYYIKIYHLNIIDFICCQVDKLWRAVTVENLLQMITYWTWACPNDYLLNFNLSPLF